MLNRLFRRTSRPKQDADRPIESEFRSGQIVAPGVYVDVVTGARVTLFEEDALPEDIRVVRSVRCYRRLEEGAGRNAGPEIAPQRRTA